MTTNQKILSVIVLSAVSFPAVTLLSRSDNAAAKPVPIPADAVPVDNVTQYAILNADGTVAQVIVITDAEMQRRAAVDGKSYVKDRDATGLSVAKNPAVIGAKYDAQKVAFVAPQPFTSWTLDAQTQTWQPPVVMPKDQTQLWTWDEKTKTWIGTPIGK